MSMTHTLKCQLAPFRATLLGLKTFELRRNDRGYEAGDRLHLCEYDHKNNRTTGRYIQAVIQYVTRLDEWVPGLEASTVVGNDYVILGLHMFHMGDAST